MALTCSQLTFLAGETLEGEGEHVPIRIRRGRRVMLTPKLLVWKNLPLPPDSIDFSTFTNEKKKSHVFMYVK